MVTFLFVLLAFLATGCEQSELYNSQTSEGGNPIIIPGRDQEPSKFDVEAQSFSQSQTSSVTANGYTLTGSSKDKGFAMEQTKSGYTLSTTFRIEK